MLPPQNRFVHWIERVRKMGPMLMGRVSMPAGAAFAMGQKEIDSLNRSVEIVAGLMTRWALKVRSMVAGSVVANLRMVGLAVGS